ncbi:MAG TPA: ParB/RepB/Spo0J family partition protein [Syntrophales bacterium]|jgi:ParB family chromosome partitioning protein|nr:ParB/RepB/Spo0J family partition protein [Syntrophales bacterium]HON22885.1 ParB/RepB/Spo0J family partition protein [Syntrophales bacterium]HOU76935.1 ParB/RepB/Spo0J family partition protein [Syntrophales bacterium]HPC31704.1 ParB/RepB/Spo0J family partition protein [Syntrophales bacterium]HQG34599.1 ParB/RepB/Spo0J family partition protein [Syntrophales bacterium]
MSAKPSLGKGLGAMFPDLLTDLDNRAAFIMCGIEELTPNRFQPRKSFSEKEQRELVESIKKSGIIQPIVARKKERGYEIIVGERRWRAAQQAGLKEVPVIVRGAEDQEIAELSLIENLQRESLNPIEEAEAYQILTRQFGMLQEEIAARIGKDRSTVANTLRLLKLPGEVKKALAAKTITSGHARALLSLDEPAEQLQALQLITARELNVREAERLVAHIKKAAAKTPKKGMKKSVYILDMERRLTERLMAAVRIRPGNRAGTIEIRFSSGDDLNRLFKLLNDIGNL